MSEVLPIDINFDEYQWTISTKYNILKILKSNLYNNNYYFLNAFLVRLLVFIQNPTPSENSVKLLVMKLLKYNNYMTIVLLQQTSSILQNIPNFENSKKRSNINIMVLTLIHISSFGGGNFLLQMLFLPLREDLCFLYLLLICFWRVWLCSTEFWTSLKYCLFISMHHPLLVKAQDTGWSCSWRLFRPLMWLVDALLRKSV